MFKVVKSVYVQADFHPNAEQILTLLQMCWYISIVNSGIVTTLFCFEVNQSFNSPILDTSSGCLPLQFMRWMLWHWAYYEPGSFQPITLCCTSPGSQEHHRARGVLRVFGRPQGLTKRVASVPDLCA